MSGGICCDNRLEVIAKAKEALLKETNIADSPEEMSVLNTFLMRCWQMDWLEKYDDEADTAENVFRKLPNLDYVSEDDNSKEACESNCGAYPHLYLEDNGWVVEWRLNDDIIFETIEGKSMYDAVKRAYFWCVENGYINLDNDAKK